MLDGHYAAETLREMAEVLDRLVTASGARSFCSDEPEWLAANVEVARPGLAFYRLLGLAPELAPTLFRPAVTEALRSVLGGDMHLELVGAVVSDETRPFTEWETHLGGIDDERWRQQGRRPRRTSTKRIAHFLFLEPMTPETGAWRVWPRRLGDPPEPPVEPSEAEWPGSRELTCEAGTVLLLDESTWHSVTPRRRPGRRRFVGAYFASAAAEATFGVDESLGDLSTDDAHFRSLLR